MQQRLWLLLTVLGACNMTSPGHAQTSVLDESILFQDIPAVTGASRYEQKLSEAPASVTLVTADEIRKYGYRNLADVLRGVRGFYTNYDRAFTFAGVRGFSRPGDYNTRILLLIDGIRVNDNIFDQALLGNESPISVDMIARVEIIRGPGSSLYGANAFFATVNVITRRGRDLQGGELTLEAGSHGTVKGHAAYGKKYGNGVETIISASREQSDGQTHYYPEFDDPTTNNGLAVNLDSEQVSQVFTRTTYGDYTFTAGAVSRRKAYPTAAYGTEFNHPDARVHDPQLGFANLNYDTRLSDKDQLMLRAGVGSYVYEGTYPYDTGPFTERSDGRWWGVEGQYTRRLAGGHKLIMGGEYQDNYRQEQNTWDNAIPLLQDERDSQRWALFVQDEYRVSADTLLNVGVRHDEYDQFGGTTNPRVALIHDLTKTTTLKLLYGRAFRAPNVYELYYHDDGGTQKANPELKPERISTYEVLLEHALRHDLRATVSVYHYEIKDLINHQLDPLDSLLVFENVGRVEAHGVEVELEGRLAPRLNGRISYAYQSAKDRDNDVKLTNSPAHLAKLNLTAPLSGNDLFAGLELQYVSKRDTEQGGVAPAYTVTNLTLSNRGWIRNMTLSASVYNLFDKQYYDPMTDSFEQDSLLQDGRTYRVRASYEF